MKIGARTVTDSFTPRTFRIMRKMVRTQRDGYLIVMVVAREVAEEGVAAGGDGDGNRHDVIDQQSAPRYDPRLLSEEMRRHDISAATVREVFDDAGVSVGNDENCHRHHCGKQEGKVGVGAKRFESLFRAVGRRGEAVGPEPHPGENRDERHSVEKVRILQMFRSADNGTNISFQSVAVITVFCSFHRLMRSLCSGTDCSSLIF